MSCQLAADESHRLQRVCSLCTAMGKSPAAAAGKNLSMGKKTSSSGEFFFSKEIPECSKGPDM